jgi:phytoene dehydrogenase-like protein
MPETEDGVTHTHDHFDVAVVGAGITGLELGALLSRDGMRVVVLEKQGETGGRARVRLEKGCAVDYGIHVVRFGPHSALSKVCRHLGREIDYIKPGTSYVIDRDGRKQIMPTSPADLFRTGMFSLLDRFMALALMLKIRAGRYDRFVELGLREWLDRHGVRGGLRRYFGLVSLSMMVCPFVERTSTGEMMRNMGRVLTTGCSVMYPRGGWAPLFRLFEDTIRSRGELRLAAPVQRIDVEGGRAVGVRTAGGRVTADSVVASVPVQHLFDGLLDESLVPDSFVQNCRRLRPTSGVVLDYVLGRKICEDSGLWYLYDPPSFGMFTSNLEPGIVPAGKQLLTWLYPEDPDRMRQPELARRIEAEVEASLFRTFPGLEAAVEWRRAMRLRMVDGVEVNIRQHKGRRPGPLVPGVQGLYLVGDSTAADGAGGDVGQESVLVCYEAITGRTCR